VAGGLSYTLGAVFYALKKPNPSKEFGFHEIFHVLIIGGTACHYVAIANYLS
jgi:hemolysin III